MERCDRTLLEPRDCGIELTERALGYAITVRFMFSSVISVVRGSYGF